jgi:hypothetical protein
MTAAPDYPGDIGAAWLVVEHMRKNGWFYKIYDDVMLDEHHCFFYSLNMPDASDMDGLLSTAICRAALLAQVTA